MKAKSFDLAWIVVNDFKKALKFYTEVVGLKVKEINEEYGWAELGGEHGGATLGIGQCQPRNNEADVMPGQNAVVTFTVDNLKQTVDSLVQKGAKLVGPMEEIPGHVKMQMVADTDGNRFQLAEMCHHKCDCGH